MTTHTPVCLACHQPSFGPFPCFFVRPRASGLKALLIIDQEAFFEVRGGSVEASGPPVSWRPRVPCRGERDLGSVCPKYLGSACRGKGCSLARFHSHALTHQELWDVVNSFALPTPGVPRSASLRYGLDRKLEPEYSEYSDWSRSLTQLSPFPLFVLSPGIRIIGATA